MVDVSEKMIEAGAKVLDDMRWHDAADTETVRAIYTAMHSAREVDEGVVAATLLAAELETTVDHAALMLRDPEYDGDCYLRMARAIAAMGEGDVR